MKRPFGRWSGFIARAASLALAAQLFLPPATNLSAEEAQVSEAGETGKAAGALVTERFGSQENLRRRIANPLTSSGTPLETMDGNTRFDAQLFFPSSDRFLEILVQPAGTGDLGTVVVGQDLDLDGTLDHSFQLLFAVSGVCANGVIACTPGTWQDCSFYRWTADSAGRLSLPPASLFELGGCYCINNDCGNNLVWQNLPVVLKDLGGGAAGAVQKARPGFSVSRVEVGGTSIAYYGQDTSRQTDPATGAVSAPQPPTQAAYYQNPFGMAGDASAAAAGQLTDPDSLYSGLFALSGAAAGVGQESACSITRVVQITQATGFCQEEVAGEILSEIRQRRFYKVRAAGPFYITRGSMPPESAIQEILAASPTAYGAVALKDYACNLAYAQSVFDSHTKVSADVRGGSAGAITISPSPPTGGIFLGRTIDYGWFDNDDSGCSRDDIGFYVWEWHEVCTRTADVAEEDVQDGCAGIETNPDCSLKAEKVDGVSTYRMFNPTGLVPLPSTRTFPGVVSHDLTRDWWKKERVYLCTDGTGQGFQEALKKRYGNIAQSVTASGSDLYYQDLRTASGSWLAESGAITLPEAEAVSPCEPACKTRRPKQDTQATIAGHAAAARTSPESYDFFYRPCGAGNICPAEGGEEVVKDCQCLNDFPEAATIMQVLRQAGKDTLCSDGVAKTPTTR